MNFIAMQQTIRDAIAANALFAPDNPGGTAVTVLKDNGASKHLIEKAFLTFGYSVAVWPCTKGSANPNEDAHQAGPATYVVRLCINPQKLKTIRNNNQSDGEFVNTSLAAIIASVLGVAPSPAGIRFQLDADAFELISFDEGMIAYHIRFSRVTVFGT
jgi:hypothetical protein